jgi:CRP/FNR family transcriptional regulator
MMGREEFLRSLALFEGVADQALARLADDLQPRTVPVGAFIFHQGDVGSTCYLIERGRVRIFVLGEDGRELSVRVLGSGEIIGEMSLLDHLPRSASAQAMEKTDLFVLHHDRLRRYLRDYPSLAFNLLQALSARIRQINEQAEELATMTVEERLMCQLRKFAEWSGEPTADGLRIAIPLTQTELATLVGTSRESVNRSLARLRDAGKVRLKNGWIVVTESL